MSFEIDSEYYAYDDDGITDWGYGWFIPFAVYFEPVEMTVKIIWLIQDVSWLAIASYFTHRWSRQWNERFSVN